MPALKVSVLLGANLPGLSDVAEPTGENIDQMLAFLPYFASPASHFYAWPAPTEPLSFPHPDYSPQVEKFMGAIYSEKFILPFDWTRWQSEARRYIEDPASLHSADLTTLRKLLTMHVRAERFTDGHIAAMIDRGHILAILRRLEAIRATMGEPPG